jgi:hypothetical protein
LDRTCEIRSREVAIVCRVSAMTMGDVRIDSSVMRVGRAEGRDDTGNRIVLGPDRGWRRVPKT